MDCSQKRAQKDQQPPRASTVKEMGMGGGIFWIHDRRSTVQGFTKRWALGCEKCLPGPAWLLLSKTGPPFGLSLYRGANKGLFVLLSRTQAGPGRTVKQEQEEISRNHVQTFICLSIERHES